jgi:HSP20 family protein
MMGKKKNVPITREDKGLRKSTTGMAPNSFKEVEQEMERLFDRLGFGWLRPYRWREPFWADLPTHFEGRMPSIDVIDRDEEVIVRAELPGVDKKDLDVSMTDDAVTIKGSCRSEEKEEKGDYYRREVSTGTFSRTVTLPADVDGEKARTSFKDGLLELTLPKVKKTVRKTIKVE